MTEVKSMWVLPVKIVDAVLNSDLSDVQYGIMFTLFEFENNLLKQEELMTPEEMVKRAGATDCTELAENLQELCDRNIIKVGVKEGQYQRIKINKNIKEWVKKI